MGRPMCLWSTFEGQISCVTATFALHSLPSSPMSAIVPQYHALVATICDAPPGKGKFLEHGCHKGITKEGFTLWKRTMPDGSPFFPRS